MLENYVIARVAHEVNKAYCESLGDMSQVGWDDAPEWQQKSAVNGVQFTRDNADVTPADSHENWYNFKKEDGWVYGEVKDEKLKTHPCMVSYDELPEDQKTKDKLYQAVVKNLI